MFKFLLVFSLSALLSFSSVSSAALIDHNARSVDGEKTALLMTLASDDVVAEFAQQGIDAEMIVQRVNALTEQEVARLAKGLAEQPKGEGFVSIFMLLFATLVVTDALGYTDLFPFVKGPDEE